MRPEAAVKAWRAAGRFAVAGVAALVLGGCAGADGPAAPRAPAASASGPGTAAPVAGAVRAAGQAYVDAVNERDLDALVRSFHPEGEIVDVTRVVSGREAIREWAAAEVIGGALRVVSVAGERPDGQRLLVHWAPEGSAGWRAHYDLTYRDGLIVRADLQYA